MEDRRIGFIGAGNIASAIIGGVTSKGYIKSEKIHIYDTDPARMQYMLCYGVTACESLQEVCQKSDVLFLTVKPQVYDAVLEQSKAFLSPAVCIVDVAAGVAISHVKSILGEQTKVIRVMPNTPLMQGFGASALVHAPPVPQEDFDYVRGMFDACGITCVVDESLIDAVTGVSGSSPAFVFSFARAMVRCGIDNGLPAKTAMALVAQTLIGSAKMLTNSGKTPDELVEMVASPNGTTVAGLASLEADGFEQAVYRAVEAAVRRSAELRRT